MRGLSPQVHTPHPALRATFSHKGRREAATRAAECDLMETPGSAWGAWLPGRWGARHVDWDHTRHHPDHYPAGRLLRPRQGIWLRLRPFRHGAGRGGFDRAPDPAAARQDL